MLLLVWIAIFLVSVILHEVCHGLAAYALGDPTAARAGRLTLSPLKHVDPFWTLLLPALMFFSTQGRFAIGMAKPVPVDFSRLHHPKTDMIWVAAAGPGANLMIAGVLSFLFHFVATTPAPPLAGEFLLYAVYFNLGLAMFNLIPIPPLDGSRILAGLLPKRLTIGLLGLERYGFPAILILYFTGILASLIVPGMDFFCRLLDVPSLGVDF